MTNTISNTATFGIGFETNKSLCSFYYALKLCITINDILFQISYIWYTMAAGAQLIILLFS